jgi:hypothetical protein
VFSQLQPKSYLCWCPKNKVLNCTEDGAAAGGGSESKARSCRELNTPNQGIAPGRPLLSSPMISKLYLAGTPRYALLKSYSPNESNQNSNFAQNRTSHKQTLFIPQEVYFFSMRCQVACVSHQWSVRFSAKMSMEEDGCRCLLVLELLPPWCREA